ncbi:MAG: hypothetical protein ABIH40_00230 [Candidatus Omnitrophota bacterium]
MREGARNKLILILSLLTAIFLLATASSCRDAAKQKRLVGQERLKRMELEEEMLTLSGRNSELEQKVSQLEGKLNRQETVCQENQRELNRQVAQLQEELNRAAKLKEEPEEGGAE